MNLKRITQKFSSTVPVILQLSETECGIASIAMIFAYHNLYVSIDQLREQCGASRDGCKAQTLMDVAKQYGFQAEAYKVELDELTDFSYPLIAYWNFNHYVVIKKIYKNKVFLNDPAHGAMVVSMDEFDKAFTGIILQITPTNSMIKINKKNSIKSFMRQWFAGFYLAFLFLLLCLFLITLIPYLNAIWLNIFVDECLIAKNFSWLPYIIILTLLSAILLISVTFMQKIVHFKLYSKASLLKSIDIFIHMLQLPMLFYSLRQRSEIVFILTKAEWVINLLFKNTLALSFGAITTIICFLCMMKINIFLSIVSLLMTTFFGILFYGMTKINLTSIKSMTQISGKLYSHSVASLQNIETVKACSLEDSVLKKWYKLFCSKIQLQEKLNNWDIAIQSLNKIYHTLSTLFLLSLGSYQISNGHISMGDVLGYYLLHLAFQKNLAAFFQAYQDSQSPYATYARLSDIISYEKDSRYLALKNKPNENLPIDKISFSRVVFYYNLHSHPILKNINLHIQQGEQVAFVGRTGSGKSSLAKLLCGFYQPTQGNIFFSGRCLSTYTAEELAKLCAYVSQDVNLHSGTLLENLLFGKENVCSSRIQQAIENACLEDLILKRCLSAQVAEGGRNFSGGEKQRIDIARALIQNTPILILDEATAALDIKTEMKLIKNLRALNKTIIFVAHRLSTIQHCDQIFVLDDGHIVEQGTHQSLMQDEGHYYSIVKNRRANELLSKSCHPSLRSG